MDSDAIIMNHNVRLEMFLPPESLDETKLILTRDIHGINAGVYLIKVEKWSLQLLAEVMSYRHFLPDEYLKYDEQSATIKLLESPAHQPHYVIAPRHFFNVYPPFGLENERPAQVGDFIVHFAGRSGREEMNDYLPLANNGSWSVPLDQLATPREVQEFWDDIAQRRNGSDGTPNEASNAIAEP